MTTLYWLDIETTGLDPKRDLILEVAMHEADFAKPFEVKLVFHNVIMWQNLRELPEVVHADPVVRAMHAESGLFDAIEKASDDGGANTYAEVENLLLDILQKNQSPPNVLAGSSVHFDLAFLQANMPHLAACFSHRHYDVSAIKLFCQSLGMSPIPKGNAHRAKDDVIESVLHAKICLRWLRDMHRAANA